MEVPNQTGTGGGVDRLAGHVARTQGQTDLVGDGRRLCRAGGVARSAETGRDRGEPAASGRGAVDVARSEPAQGETRSQTEKGFTDQNPLEVKQNDFVELTQNFLPRTSRAVSFSDAAGGIARREAAGSGA